MAQCRRRGGVRAEISASHRGRRGRREVRTRRVLQGIIQGSMMMVLSVVGGIGGTFSTGVPQSWRRRHRTWILMLYSGTRVVLLGWFSCLFGISNMLCKCPILPTNPRGPSMSDGWSHCFYSSLFEAHMVWLLLSWEACPGIPAEA